jgi:hypothetical protein
VQLAGDRDATHAVRERPRPRDRADRDLASLTPNARPVGGGPATRAKSLGCLEHPGTRRGSDALGSGVGVAHRHHRDACLGATCRIVTRDGFTFPTYPCIVTQKRIAAAYSQRLRRPRWLLWYLGTALPALRNAWDSRPDRDAGARAVAATSACVRPTQNGSSRRGDR